MWMCRWACSRRQIVIRKVFWKVVVLREDSGPFSDKGKGWIRYLSMSMQISLTEEATPGPFSSMWHFKRRGLWPKSSLTFPAKGVLVVALVWRQKPFPYILYASLRSALVFLVGQCWVGVVGHQRGEPQCPKVLYFFRASFGFRYLQYLKGAIEKLGRVSFSASVVLGQGVS